MKELSGLNTSYPGTIVDFDPAEQTATVKVAIEKFYRGINTTQLYEDYTRPLIHDVPVHFPQCSGFSLTMPVKAGDSCLLIFAQRGIDHWLYEGKEESGRDPLTGWPNKEHHRRFETGNALCLVGFNPIPKAISGFSDSNVELRNAEGTQKISLSPTGAVEVTTFADISLTCPTRILLDAPLVQVTGFLQVNESINAGVSMGAPMIISPGPSFSIPLGEVEPDAVPTISMSDGVITVAGDVIAGDISLKWHTHQVPVTGGSSSGVYTSNAPD